MDRMMSGYDGFYTLKPERWKEDLYLAYEEKIKRVSGYHQKELSKYKQKFNWFLEGTELINEHV
jgi:hypothetical protein